MAAPVVLIYVLCLFASANAGVLCMDIVTGVPRMQRRVAISEGRLHIQRLNDIHGDPVVAGQFLVMIQLPRSGATDWTWLHNK